MTIFYFEKEGIEGGLRKYGNKYILYTSRGRTSHISISKKKQRNEFNRGSKRLYIGTLQQAKPLTRISHDNYVLQHQGPM
jgi:hypothetical protein